MIQNQKFIYKSLSKVVFITLRKMQVLQFLVTWQRVKDVWQCLANCEPHKIEVYLKHIASYNLCSPKSTAEIKVIWQMAYQLLVY